eukprot:scaffold538600_cov30-Prasinocladus_malaysianus.AAC.2
MTSNGGDCAGRCAGCKGVAKTMAANMWQHFLVPCCFAPLAKGMCSADKDNADVVSTWVGEYQVTAGPLGPSAREKSNLHSNSRGGQTFFPGIEWLRIHRHGF